MTKSILMLSLGFASALTCGAATKAYTWKAVETDPDNDVSLAEHYFDGTAPVDPADIAAVDHVVYNDKSRLTLPADKTFSSPYGVWLKGATTGCLTVDVSNAVWVQPDRNKDAGEGPYTDAERFVLQNPHGANIFWTAASSTYKGSFRLSNAVMRVTQSGTDKAWTHVDFDQGRFDFSRGASEQIRYADWSSVKRIRMAFHEGSEFISAPLFLVYIGAVTNEFVFDGGTHTFDGFRLQQLAAGSEAVPDRTRICVKGDAKLRIRQLQIVNETANRHTMRMDVSENGIVEVYADNCAFTQAADTPGLITIRDGGQLVNTWDWDFTLKNPHLVVTNASVTCTKSTSSLQVGGGDIRILKGGAWTGAEMTLAGADGLLTVDGGSLALSALTVGGPSSSLKLTSNNSATLVAPSGSLSVTTLRLGGGETDRGTLDLGATTLAVGTLKGGLGTSALTADGATIIAKGATETLLTDVGTATVAAGGLVISSDYDVTIPQSLSGPGELTLSGTGVKTLAGAYDVAKIVVTGGTLVFADGATAACGLEVRNGAKVVFAGNPASVGLTALTVGDATTSGVLTFTKGQTLAVATSIDLVRVNIELSGDYARGDEETFLTTSGTVADGSADAWSEALIVAGAATDRSYVLETTDAAGGTSFTMSVRDYAVVLAQPAGSSSEEAGAVTFGVNSRMLASVSNAATLTVSGPVGRGAFAKEGEGRLYLTGTENLFLGGLNLLGGLLSVPSVAALGYASDAVDGLTLSGGTFEYTGAGDETYAGDVTVAAPVNLTSVVVKADAPLTLKSLQVEKGCLVKRGVGTLTVAPAANTTLTLSQCTGRSDGVNQAPVATERMEFDEFGTPPPKGFLGFNVAEGEMVLKGDETTTFDIPHTMMVGGRMDSTAAQAQLTIDGARAVLGSTGKSWWVHLCPKLLGDDPGRRPSFNVINGANVTSGTMAIGSGLASVSESKWAYPTVRVDRATLDVGQLMPYASSSRLQMRLSDAVLYLRGVEAYGVSFLDATNSVIARNDTKACINNMHFNQSGEGGTWTFRDGTVLYLSQFSSKASSLTFAFNGATWETGGGVKPTFHLYNAAKITLKTTGAGLTLPVAEEKTVSVARRISGDGPLVKTGDGTLVFETQGTYDTALTTKTELDDPVTLAFEGLLDVRGGAVEIAETACRAGGAYRAAEGASVDFGGNALAGATFSGGGTFSDAALTGATIACAVADDGTVAEAPTFADVTFAAGERVIVDFGRTKDDPPPAEAKGQVVARVPAGTDISTWRAKNLGRNFGAKLAIDDSGVVTADIGPRGLTIIVR